MENSGTICIFGQGGHGALANSFHDALIRKGTHVCFFDANQYPLIQNTSLGSKVTNKLFGKSYFCRRRMSQEFNEKFIDFVLRNKCQHVLLINPDWIMPATVCALREYEIRTILFHADNPFPPHYRSRPESIELSSSVDCCLVWSHSLVDRLKEVGVQAKFMPFAWDPNLHPPRLRQDKNQSKSAAFIGGWDSQREEFLNSFSANYPLAIYGPAYWTTKSKKSSRVKSAWVGTTALGTNFSRITTDHQVNLNILRNQHITYDKFDGVIMRNFEVPGCGGFLMSTRTETAMSLFKEDEEAVYFDNIDDCLDKVNFYTRHPDAIRRIVTNAHKLTTKHHTYDHRADEIIEIFNGL